MIVSKCQHFENQEKSYSLSDFSTTQIALVTFIFLQEKLQSIVKQHTKLQLNYFDSCDTINSVFNSPRLTNQYGISRYDTRVQKHLTWSLKHKSFAM